MWYPGKFWRDISYSCVDGRLRDELGIDGRPGWRHRRRWRMALRRDSGFGVAVLDGRRPEHVDGWGDTVDHRFDSITLRFEDRSTGEVAWVRTTSHPAPARSFWSPTIVPSGDAAPVEVTTRSGTMVATWAEVDGRSVEVLQPVGGPVDVSRLGLVPLESVLVPA